MTLKTKKKRKKKEPLSEFKKVMTPQIKYLCYSRMPNCLCSLNNISWPPSQITCLGLASFAELGPKWPFAQTSLHFFSKGWHFGCLWWNWGVQVGTHHSNEVESLSHRPVESPTFTSAITHIFLCSLSYRSWIDLSVWYVPSRIINKIETYLSEFKFTNKYAWSSSFWNQFCISYVLWWCTYLDSEVKCKYASSQLSVKICRY